MCAVYRGEQYELTWGPEKARTDTPSSAANAVTFMTNVFGIINSATLPDPTYDWQPVWSYATTTYRNWYKMYVGKLDLRGSIPDIWLLDGRVLRLAVGTCASKGTTSGTKGSTTLNAATAAGDTAIDLISSTNFTDNDYVRIGDEGAWNVEYRQITGAPNPFAVVALTYAHAAGEAVVEVNGILSSDAAAGDVSVAVTDGTPFATNTYICIGAGSRNAELRQVTSNAVSPVTFTQPLTYAHTSTTIETGVDLQTITSSSPNYWTHTIYDAYDVYPITLAVTNIKDDLSVGLERKYYGGKVSRASIFASEGEELRISLDDMMFRDVRFESPDTYASTNERYAVQTRPTFTLPSTERYLFSQGSLAFFGTEFARVRRFAIEVNNNLEPRYYISDDTGGINRIPYEFVPGKKEYTISASVDINDDRFFMNLLNEGVPVDGVAFSLANRKGFTFSATFTRGTNDSITIQFPSYTPAVWSSTPEREGCYLRRVPHNIMTDQPLVNVDLDIIARDCKITVKDTANVFFP